MTGLNVTKAYGEKVPCARQRFDHCNRFVRKPWRDIYYDLFLITYYLLISYYLFVITYLYAAVVVIEKVVA